MDQYQNPMYIIVVLFLTIFYFLWIKSINTLVLSGYRNNNNWLKWIPNETKLGDLYIPGEHHIQTESISNMISNGIRLFQSHVDIKLFNNYLHIFKSEFILILSKRGIKTNDWSDFKNNNIGTLRGSIWYIDQSTIPVYTLTPPIIFRLTTRQIGAWSVEKSGHVYAKIILIPIVQYRNWYIVNKYISLNELL